MGSYTSRRHLYKPANNETVWGDLVNANFDELDKLYRVGASVPSEATLFNTGGFPTDGNYFDVTGTTNISAIKSSGVVGTVIGLHFQDSLTIVHNATTLVLPNGDNITTVAGMELTFLEYAANSWRMIAGTGLNIHNHSGGTEGGSSLNTPTITTPKIDVINEETAGSGVTIDSCLIKDGGVAAVTDQGGGSVLKCKVLNIGDWNMDLNASTSVAHGLTLGNIRDINITIRNDTASGFYGLLIASDGSAITGGYTIDATNVVLNRVTGGFFDGTDFDSTSYNRGWIVIWYV